VPLLGQLLKRIGAIFVQPGKAGQGKRTLELQLKEGDTVPGVIILPEGARIPDG